MFTMIAMILQNKKGQGMVEYGLILALISIAGMAAITLIGPKILTTFTDVNTAL